MKTCHTNDWSCRRLPSVCGFLMLGIRGFQWGVCWYLFAGNLRFVVKHSQGRARRKVKTATKKFCEQMYSLTCIRLELIWKRLKEDASFADNKETGGQVPSWVYLCDFMHFWQAGIEMKKYTACVSHRKNKNSHHWFPRFKQVSVKHTK